MNAPAISLEPVNDAAWLNDFIVEHWGAPGVISRGHVWTGADLTAIRAMDGEDLAGLVSWRADPDDWEIVTFDSLMPGQGVGTRLMEAAIELARRGGAKRLWLVTTNDNLDALRFYQRRGWRLTALYADAMAEKRRIKPSIPESGHFGIPIRDEIELEYRL